MTLVEVLVSMLVLGIMITGVVNGFIQSHHTAEWSAYSLAAQSLAMQPIEQARAAKWDPYASVPINELTNLPARTTNILDIPASGTNLVWATNRITVRTVSVNPPLQEIYVECTWRFLNRRVFTNSVITYRAPGQA
jgi:Tfp pilus assembly protein PilV